MILTHANWSTERFESTRSCGFNKVIQTRTPHSNTQVFKCLSVLVCTTEVGSHFALPMSNVCNLSLTLRIVAIKLPEAWKPLLGARRSKPRLIKCRNAQTTLCTSYTTKWKLYQNAASYLTPLTTQLRFCSCQLPTLTKFESCAKQVPLVLPPWCKRFLSPSPPRSTTVKGLLSPISSN